MKNIKWGGKDRWLDMGVCSTGGRRGVGGALALLQIGVEINDGLTRSNWASDRDAILKDLDIAMRAIDDVQSAFDNSQIKFGYNINNLPNILKLGTQQEYLYKVANWLLRGDDGGDKSVRENGQVIWNELNKKKMRIDDE